MFETSLRLTPPQIRKLIKKQAIQLQHTQIGDGIAILLDKDNAKRVMQSKHKCKGCRILLSDDELDANDKRVADEELSGGSIADKFNRAFSKKNMRKVGLALGEYVGKPVLKAIPTAVSAFAGLGATAAAQNPLVGLAVGGITKNILDKGVDKLFEKTSTKKKSANDIMMERLDAINTKLQQQQQPVQGQGIEDELHQSLARLGIKPPSIRTSEIARKPIGMIKPREGGSIKSIINKTKREIQRTVKDVKRGTHDIQTGNVGDLRDTLVGYGMDGGSIKSIINKTKREVQRTVRDVQHGTHDIQTGNIGDLRDTLVGYGIHEDRILAKKKRGGKKINFVIQEPVNGTILSDRTVGKNMHYASTTPYPEGRVPQEHPSTKPNDRWEMQDKDLAKKVIKRGGSFKTVGGSFKTIGDR